jgi:hypothetical protein
MSITAECNSCGRRYQAPDEMAGRQVRCKQCGNVFPLPSAETSDEVDLDALGALEPTFDPTQSNRPRDVESEEKDDESSEDASSPGPIRQGRMNVRFAFAYAKEVDQILPIVLVLGSIGLLAYQCFDRNSTNINWIAISWTLVALVAYAAIIASTTLAAVRSAGRRLGYQMPRTDRWRISAAYLPAFVIGYIMWIAGDGWLPALFLGCLAGVVLSTAALWLLFRLQPDEIAMSSIHAAFGFFVGLLVAGGLLWGINAVLLNALVASKQADAMPASPIAPTFAWITQEQKDALAAKTAKPAPRVFVQQPEVAEAPPPEPKISASPVISKTEIAPIKDPFDEVLRPLTDSDYLALLHKSTDISIDVVDTRSWKITGSTKFALDTDPAGNHYVLSPDGKQLARIATFPRLSVQYRTLGGGLAAKVIYLDDKLGTPQLIGFIGSTRVLVRWQGSGISALEIIDVTSTSPHIRIDTPIFDNLPNALTISDDGTLAAITAKTDDFPTLYVYNLTSGKSAGSVRIASLDPRWPVTPSGMAFSSESNKLAVLFEAKGSGLLLSYQLDRAASAITPTGEHVYPSGVLPGADTHCFAKGAIAWLSDQQTWLVYGQGIFEAAQGSLVADLGITNVESVHVTPAGDIELIRQIEGTTQKQIAILHLDMSKISALKDKLIAG